MIISRRRRNRDRSTMNSASCEKIKQHAVFVPYPSQGHIAPMLELGKLLHSHGFRITFVNTEFNHQRLLRSQGVAALSSVPDFCFESFPDGLPLSNPDATQDLPALCNAVSKNFLSPFLQLLERLNSRVTRIVSDGMSSFCIDAGRKLSIPTTIFWTASACGLMGYLHFDVLVQKGITPLKDESYLSNGYLETPLEGIPGMRNMKLKHLPTFARTTDLNDVFFSFLSASARRVGEGDAIIINTMEELERPVLEALSAMLPSPIYTIGPISLMSGRLRAESQLRGSLWKEDAGCAEWLDRRPARSVVYVNYGSITVMSDEQMAEFAWGLASSGYDFLWVIRGDLVKGEAALLPAEFWEATEGRGKMTGWCKQKEVLLHPAVGVFLTHAGWNSIMESLTAGVPVMCWPFFAEQSTNCKYACDEWGVGVEIDNRVKREEVKRLIREVMGGEKGKEMRAKAAEWKETAATAVDRGGSSFLHFHTLLTKLLITPQPLN